MSDILKLHQLKVTLKGSEPPIWRRFLIVSNTSLLDVHYILQVVMGWDNCHLHEFRVGKTSFGEPFEDSDGEMYDDSEVALCSVLTRAKQKMTYIYDFGDSWMHEIVLEKTLPYEDGAPLVQCLAGERACPPEDCGGLWGFYHFVEAVTNPSHPDHEAMTDWYEGFEPDAFDLDDINRTLDKMTGRKRARKPKQSPRKRGPRGD
ncbi:MAG: plasmid pRiA4b ORF-3 family protein [Candidatus Hydrogenedentes bacterium]|nr:plasmid pRiA4b ORF-3 family protein [Candidatus Hydrogenedentota bacterium]